MTQYVQIPNEICKKVGTKENLVYAVLRMYMNGKTKISFPSIQTIVKDTKLSKMTVLKAIDLLQKEGHIIIDKVGRSNRYTFKSFDKDYERFTFEFLKNFDTTPEIKAYVIGTLSKSFLNEEKDKSVCSLPEITLSQEFGISPRTISNHDKELINTNILNIIRSNVKDNQTGLTNQIRTFDLALVCQAILYVNEKADRNAAELERLKKEVEELRSVIKQM